jgi:hypothetical protein
MLRCLGHSQGEVSAPCMKFLGMISSLFLAEPAWTVSVGILYFQRFSNLVETFATLSLMIKAFQLKRYKH